MTAHPEPSAVAIARSRWWDEGPVRVFLAWPEPPAPPGGFPVLCVLDGEALFGTAVEAARLQAGRPDATGVPHAVILGIGHPTADRAGRDAERRRDYTPPGSGALLALMEAAILPAAAARVPVDRGRVALFGHSLAGLVPLHALLSGCRLFHRLVAASPSLWWADRAMLHRARAWSRSFEPGPPPPLLLTVGGAERPDPAQAGTPRFARQSDARMVDGVLELAGLLAPHLAVTCTEFPGENHGSVLPAAIGRAIPFALGAGA